MLLLFGGFLAFTLYFLYDLNSVKKRHRLPQSFFALGTLLIGLITVTCLIRDFGIGAISRSIWAKLLFVPAALCFALMIYSLFFALPFESTYVRQEKTPIYDRGMYALCRHPGILWFWLTYLFLTMAWQTATVLSVSLELCLLNTVYGLFQDLWTFPRTFDGYERYREQTPFLIPTKRSITGAWKTRL